MNARRPALAVTLLVCGLSAAPWVLEGHQDKKKTEGLQV